MILIFLPVKDESKNIENTISELISFFKTLSEKYMLVFIDDHSSDDTSNIIRRAQTPEIVLYRNQFDKGKGSALKTGFVLVNTVFDLCDDDIVVFMDGDGQIKPKDVKTLLKIMNLYDSDIVIGNKRHQFSNVSYSPMRKMISFCYNVIIRILFGISLQDTQCGIKIFRKYALDKVIDKICVKKYAFDLELIVAFKEMNLRVADAPVYIESQTNIGSVSFQTMFMTFADTLKIWVNKQKGFYK